MTRIDPTAPAIRPRRAAVRGSRVLRALALSVVAALAVGGLVLASADAASAHAELLSTTPNPGQVYPAEGPAAVTLEFSEDIVATGTEIIAVDGTGAPIAVGPTQVLGPKVSASLPSGLKGEYQVRWRAVSADGHPVGGTIDFGVGPGATGRWTAPAGATRNPADTMPRLDGGQGDPGVLMIVLVVVGVLAAVALIVVIVLLVGGRGDGDGEDDDDADEDETRP